jgi:hypothetical protein
VRFNLLISVSMRSVRLERIGRAYSVIDAKRFALRRCGTQQLLPVCTLVRCRSLVTGASFSPSSFAKVGSRQDDFKD